MAKKMRRLFARRCLCLLLYFSPVLYIGHDPTQKCRASGEAKAYVW